MTEEKAKEELKKLNVRMMAVAVIGATILIVGAMIALWGIISIDNKMIPDNEHITDQDMPVRDIENATYTWTNDEIEDMARDALDMFLTGGVIGAIGAAIAYSVIFTVPTKKKLHEVNCDILDHGPVAYCPDCGLKLQKPGDKK